MGRMTIPGVPLVCIRLGRRLRDAGKQAADLTSAWLQPALDALPQLKPERKIFFIVNRLDSFVGNRHSPEALRAVDEFLNTSPIDPELRLKIPAVRDDLERTVRIRAQ